MAHHWADPPTDLEGGGLRRLSGRWEPREPLRRGRERWAFDERLLGDTDFVAQRLAEVEQAEPSLVRVCAAEVIPRLCCELSKCLTVAPSLITSQSCLPAAVAARAVVSWIAVRQLGVVPAQVARTLGVSLPTVLRGVTQAPLRARAFGLDLDQIARQCQCLS